VALATSTTVVGPFTSASTVLYSAPTTYQRDLVITNIGPSTVSVASATTGTYAIGVLVSPGQSVIFQGPLPSGNVAYGLTNASTLSTSVQVGLASVYSVI
jgi:hypothetical protein